MRTWSSVLDRGRALVFGFTLPVYPILPLHHFLRLIVRLSNLVRRQWHTAGYAGARLRLAYSSVNEYITPHREPDTREE